MAIPAKNMDEVLAELDLIIDKSIAGNHKNGIFAWVYRRTTAQVKQAIADKYFDDNARMERLDVAFANYYLTAWQQYTQNASCSASWKTAFDAKDRPITIIQQVMLGMNAHINLDLGLATATFEPGIDMESLRNDFVKINQILSGLVNEMQEKISKVSRLMLLLDILGKNTDEQIINFSMAEAREQAWSFACFFAKEPESEQQTTRDKKDKRIAAFGKLIESPPGIGLKMIVALISLFETKNVKTILSKLREPV